MATETNVTSNPELRAERASHRTILSTTRRHLGTKRRPRPRGRYAGVKSDAIDIDFEDGVLTIQGHVAPRGNENVGYLLQGYGVGGFYRTFRVSEQVDAEQDPRVRKRRVDAALAEGRRSQTAKDRSRAAS